MKNLLYNFLQYSKDIKFYSNDTLTHFKYDVLKLIEYLKYRKGKMEINIEDVRLQECIERLETYKETRNVSQSTLATLSNSMRQYFKYCAMMGEKVGFNVEQLPIIKKEHKPFDMMKKEEYEILIQAPLFYEEKEIIAERNQLIIEIPYRTGLRRSEILRCKFEHFHNENRQFQILGKGGYHDRVFFTEELRKKVLKYESDLKEYTKKRPFKPDFLFVGLDNKNRGNQLAPKYINIMFHKYSENLLKEGKITRLLHPHMERHAFATNCVYAGLSQQATTRLMRHRDPKTTEGYYHMNDTWLKSQFDKIS